MRRNKLSRVCVLCKKDIKNETKYGKLHRIKCYRVHYYCLLLSETITQSGKDEDGILGFLTSDIAKELEKSKLKKCCYCNEMMATLGCVHKHCNRKFHLYCGYVNNAMFHFDKFTAHCNLHTKPSNLPVHIKKSLKDYHCLICLEAYDAQTKISDLFWASCCKSGVVLHLDCIRHMALSAGYFTKCPGCNDKTKFIESIKAWGVFVPERDASWELDGNAFSDLLYVHNTCDVQKCICPNGRDFSKESGDWKLVLCKMCGSSGTHMACTTQKRRFLCEVCKLNPDESGATTLNNIGTETDRINSTNTTDDDYKEEEFIEIEAFDNSELNDKIGSTENEGNYNIEVEYENMEPLISYNTMERSDILLHDVFPELYPENDRKSLKRSFKDITNSSDENFKENGLCKKLKEESNMELIYDQTKAMDLESSTEDLSSATPHISEKIKIEASPLQKVVLDEDSEVEFISCTMLDSLPPVPTSKTNVELFLKTVISKPYHLSEENPKRRKKRKSKKGQLQTINKTGKHFVQLSLENFITRTNV